MAEEKDPDECEQTLNRILEVKHVEGYITVNELGLQKNKRIENTLALQYATLFWDITKVAQNVVRDLDPSNELKYYRIKTKKNEFLASFTNDELILVSQKNENTSIDE